MEHIEDLETTISNEQSYFQYLIWIKNNWGKNHTFGVDQIWNI